MEETGGGFSDVLMEPHNSQAQVGSKKILHFSDGILEECTAEENYVTESDGKTTEAVAAVDPSTMTWGPWLWHKTVSAGSGTLRVCDYLGETLADFFGITTPKYQLEIEEYRRMAQEEEEEKRQQDLEMGGWSASAAKDPVEKSGDVPMVSLLPAESTTAQGQTSGSEELEKF